MDAGFIRDTCLHCRHALIGSKPGFRAALCLYGHAAGVPGVDRAGVRIETLSTCPLVAEATREAA